jgi:hypothetical protein
LLNLAALLAHHENLNICGASDCKIVRLTGIEGQAQWLEAQLLAVNLVYLSSPSPLFRGIVEELEVAIAALVVII